jgi:hypothetical protein
MADQIPNLNNITVNAGGSGSGGSKPTGPSVWQFFVWGFVVLGVLSLLGNLG